MTLLAPFDVERDREIQDFNYEVDALEDEHIRRDVHTTKLVPEEEQSSEPVTKQDVNENNNANNSQRIIKNKKNRDKGKNKESQAPKQTPKVAEDRTKQTSWKTKREKKKSFDLYKEEYRSDDNSEPHPIIPTFSGGNKSTYQAPKEKSKFSFGPANTNLPPAIPPPFSRKPNPSMESGNGFGTFDNMDDPMYFKMLNRSFEKIPQTVSREFMDNNNDHNDRMHNVFKGFNTPFASGEFGKMFEPQNEQNRNLIHPTPKYHK